MKIIEIAALENGAHKNQIIESNVVPPNGWAVIPDNIELPSTFPFVNLTIDENGNITGVTAGVVPEPEPEETEPSEAEDAAALLIDHEYRLTLLELGII